MAAAWFLSQFTVTILQGFFLSCHSFQHTSLAQLQAGEAHSSIIRAGQPACVCFLQCLSACLWCLLDCLCFLALRRSSLPHASSRLVKQDGVTAPRGLMPTNYGIGDHFWKCTPGTYLFTTALKFLGRFSVLYLGCLKEILDLGWIEHFHWVFFSHSLCITCQTVCCFVWNPGLFLFSFFNSFLDFLSTILSTSVCACPQLKPVLKKLGDWVWPHHTSRLTRLHTNLVQKKRKCVSSHTHAHSHKLIYKTVSFFLDQTEKTVGRCSCRPASGQVGFKDMLEIPHSTNI